MVISNGCSWQQKSFKVYMGNDTKAPMKCLSCKRYKGRKHKVCKFDDRGYVLIDKTRRKREL